MTPDAPVTPAGASLAAPRPDRVERFVGWCIAHRIAVLVLIGLVTALFAALAARIDAASPTVRRRQAASVVARIDGLLLVRQISGAVVADEAAAELGIRAASTR